MADTKDTGSTTDIVVNDNNDLDPFRCRIEQNHFLRYAGIGSRTAADNVIEVLKRIAAYLYAKGYTLTSGGARGSDTAFESQAGIRKEIYIPWNGFNGRYTSEEGVFIPSPETIEKATKIARKFHPRYDYLSTPSKLLMIRNGYQILGKNLDMPVDFVVCYTPDGCETAFTRTALTGGTGQAISIAYNYNVPVFNVFNIDSVYKLKELLDSRENTFHGNQTLSEIT
jgi:hypothetical protein